MPNGQLSPNCPRHVGRTLALPFNVPKNVLERRRGADVVEKSF